MSGAAAAHGGPAHGRRSAGPLGSSSSTPTPRHHAARPHCTPARPSAAPPASPTPACMPVTAATRAMTQRAEALPLPASELAVLDAELRMSDMQGSCGTSNSTSTSIGGINGSSSSRDRGSSRGTLRTVPGVPAAAGGEPKYRGSCADWKQGQSDQAQAHPPQRQQEPGQEQGARQTPPRQTSGGPSSSSKPADKAFEPADRAAPRSKSAAKAGRVGGYPSDDIMPAIKAAQTWQQLRAAVAQHWQGDAQQGSDPTSSSSGGGGNGGKRRSGGKGGAVELNHVHLSAALMQLARVVTAKRPARGHSPAATAQHLNRTEGAAAGSSGRSSGAEAGLLDQALASAGSSLGSPDSGSAGPSSVGQGSTGPVSTGQGSRSVSAFTSELCGHAGRLLPSCQARQLSNMAWAVAKLYTAHDFDQAQAPTSHPHYLLRGEDAALALRLFRAVMRHCQRPGVWQSLAPQEASSLIYAVGLVQQRWVSEPASRVLSATPLITAQWLHSWMEASLPLLPQMSPQAVSNSAWGLAVILGAPAEGEWDNQANTASSSSSSSSDNSIVGSSGGCVSHREALLLDVGPAALHGWLLAACDASAEQLHQYPAASLAVVSWACAKLQFTPGQAWLRSFLVASHALLPRMSSQDLANIGWAATCWQMWASKAAHRAAQQASLTPAGAVPSKAGARAREASLTPASVTSHLAATAPKGAPQHSVKPPPNASAPSHIPGPLSAPPTPASKPPSSTSSPSHAPGPPSGPRAPASFSSLWQLRPDGASPALPVPQQWQQLLLATFEQRLLTATHMHGSAAVDGRLSSTDGGAARRSSGSSSSSGVSGSGSGRGWGDASSGRGSGNGASMHGSGGHAWLEPVGTLNGITSSSGSSSSKSMAAADRQSKAGSTAWESTRHSPASSPSFSSSAPVPSALPGWHLQPQSLSVLCWCLHRLQLQPARWASQLLMTAALRSTEDHPSPSPPKVSGRTEGEERGGRRQSSHPRGTPQSTPGLWSPPSSSAPLRRSSSHPVQSAVEVEFVGCGARGSAGAAGHRPDLQTRGNGALSARDAQVTTAIAAAESAEATAVVTEAVPFEGPHVLCAQPAGTLATTAGNTSGQHSGIVVPGTALASPGIFAEVIGLPVAGLAAMPAAPVCCNGDPAGTVQIVQVAAAGGHGMAGQQRQQRQLEAAQQQQQQQQQQHQREAAAQQQQQQQQREAAQQQQQQQQQQRWRQHQDPSRSPAFTPSSQPPSRSPASPPPRSYPPALLGPRALTSVAVLLSHLPPECQPSGQGDLHAIIWGASRPAPTHRTEAEAAKVRQRRQQWHLRQRQRRQLWRRRQTQQGQGLREDRRGAAQVSVNPPGLAPSSHLPHPEAAPGFPTQLNTAARASNDGAAAAPATAAPNQQPEEEWGWQRFKRRLASAAPRVRIQTRRSRGAGRRTGRGGEDDHTGYTRAVCALRLMWALQVTARRTPRPSTAPAAPHRPPSARPPSSSSSSSSAFSPSSASSSSASFSSPLSQGRSPKPSPAQQAPPSAPSKLDPEIATARKLWRAASTAAALRRLNSNELCRLLVAAWRLRLRPSAQSLAAVLSALRDKLQTRVISDGAGLQGSGTVGPAFGSTAPPLAPLPPALRARVAQAAAQPACNSAVPPPPLLPPALRARVAQAAATLLRNAASRQPALAPAYFRHASLAAPSLRAGRGVRRSAAGVGRSAAGVGRSAARAGQGTAGAPATVGKGPLASTTAAAGKLPLASTPAQADGLRSAAAEAALLIHALLGLNRRAGLSTPATPAPSPARFECAPSAHPTHSAGAASAVPATSPSGLQAPMECGPQVLVAMLWAAAYAASLHRAVTWPVSKSVPRWAWCPALRPVKRRLRVKALGRRGARSGSSGGASSGASIGSKRGGSGSGVGSGGGGSVGSSGSRSGRGSGDSGSPCGGSAVNSASKGGRSDSGSGAGSGSSGSSAASATGNGVRASSRTLPTSTSLSSNPMPSPAVAASNSPSPTSPSSPYPTATSSLTRTSTSVTPMPSPAVAACRTLLRGRWSRAWLQALPSALPTLTGRQFTMALWAAVKLCHRERLPPALAAAFVARAYALLPSPSLSAHQLSVVLHLLARCRGLRLPASFLPAAESAWELKAATARSHSARLFRQAKAALVRRG